MAYIGNNLQVAYPAYTNIDDISGSFNGSTTSFALLVNGAAPVPLPLSSNQCLISVGGVIQRPDDSGTEGFRLSGGNIVFSSAPSTGEDFFGVILAGADYVNVGANFPDGVLAAPSITFDQDTDTGFYRSGSGAISVSSNGVDAGTFSSSGFQAVAGSAGSPSITTSGDTNTGIFFPAADTIAFAEGGAEAARLDSSGRLLVGTSTARDFFGGGDTPALQVEGLGNAGRELSVTSSTASASGGVVLLAKQRSGAVGGQTIVQSGDQLGYLGFQGSDGTKMLAGAAIEATVDGTPGANDLPTRLVFSTCPDGSASPVERMRITQAGFTKLSKTGSYVGASGVFHEATNLNNVSGDISFLTGLGSNCNNTSSYHYIASTGGADKYYIYGNGTTGTPSDNRLKKNIETARSGYLDDLNQLRVVKYNWNEQEDGDPKELGVIAQEVEAVFPGLIQDGPAKEDGTSYKGVKTSVLPFMLLKALQEATARIESLEAEVAALKAS